MLPKCKVVSLRLRRARLISALVAAASACLVGSAQTQVINESFTGTTTSNNWVFTGSGFTPSLTANNTAGVVDPAGSGWLQLTDTSGSLATSAYYNQSFNSANTTVYATFNYQSFGGANGTTNGGDGLVFFLFDGSKAFSVGAYGGSIGYAQKTAAGGGGADINGLNGGYLGVALDEYGNFSAASEGRVGGYNGTTAPVTESISVRGPGSGLNGYAFLGGSGTLAQAIDSAARPTQTNTVQILLSATNQLTVTLQQGGTTPQTVLQMDLSGYARPNSLKFGFASGSGAATNNHLVNNLTVSTIQASLWKNAAGDGAWLNNNNWNPTVVPAPGSDILFDNSTVSTAQTIATGANQSVRSLTFDAPFAYTLNNNTINFNAGGTPGFSGIAVTSTHGTGTFTVNSAVSASNAIGFRNNSTSTLNVNGNVALGANTLTLDGTGAATNVAGVVSGTGAVIKNDAGTATLSGANTYSGGTTLNAGTLNANNATALGTGAVTLAGGTLASTNGSTVANNLTLSASSGLTNITASGTLTQTAPSTLLMSGATQSGAVKLSNSGTAQTLTVQVDAGSSTISGAIANGGTAASGNLTKTGSGTLVLSGANTYTGTTAINAGTVQLGASNVLASASSVNLGASGNLNLNGFSNRIGTLTAAGGATLDFGSPTGANTFVFGTYVAPASGVLVVNNWQQGVDTLATTVAGQNVSTIYLSGFGVATEAGATSSTAYGNAYALTALTQVNVVWQGNSSSNWGTNNNWVGGARPTSTQIAVFNSTGSGRTAVNLNNGYTIAGLKFDTSAPAYTITGANTLTLSGNLPYVQQKSSANQVLGFSQLSLGNNTVFDVTGSGNLTVSAALSGSKNLIKDGTGTGRLILSGNNSNWQGNVYVNNGILRAANTNALGNGPLDVSVADGATLELAGGIAPANNITLQGQGVGGAGALHNVGGSNTVSGLVTEAANATLAADTGTTLNLAGGISGNNTNTTFSGAGSILVDNIATGTGTVTVNGAAVTYNGTTVPNTYTGDTTVNSGSLTLAMPAGSNAVAGNLNINGGTATLGASNQIADTSTVNLAGTGKLDLAGNAETITALNSASATSTVALGAGSLTIAGVSNTTSNYAGTLTGTAASSLNLNSTGSTYLSGNNAGFAGMVNVTNGTLNASGSNSVLGTGAVAVTGQGNLQVQGGLSLANAVTVASTGPNGNGALENVAGNNTLAGNVTVTGSSRINSDNGTLTLAGTVATGANALVFGGNGNTTLSGALTGSGPLSKDGAGTLTLASANTFTGSTSVNAGSLVLAANNALNNSASLSIASGASVSLANVASTVGGLSGAGTLAFGSSGTMTLTGTGTFSGAFTGAGTLILGSGSSLTLGAGFNDANLNIVLAGGTLNLNGQTSTFGNLSVTANSVIDFGAGVPSSVTFANLAASAGTTLTVSNWTDMSDYFYATNSPGFQGTAPINQVVFNGFTGASTKWVSYDHEVSPVPEPAHYGALLLALTGLAHWWRRRQASTA